MSVPVPRPTTAKTPASFVGPVQRGAPSSQAASPASRSARPFVPHRSLRHHVPVVPPSTSCLRPRRQHRPEKEGIGNLIKKIIIPPLALPPGGHSLKRNLFDARPLFHLTQRPSSAASVAYGLCPKVLRQKARLEVSRQSKSFAKSKSQAVAVGGPCL